MEEWERQIAEFDTDNEDWLQIDEFDDVRASLLMLESALGCIEQDKVFWKWSILATHSAVQGACVCFLTRTDGGGALDKRSEMSLLAYHNQSSQMASSKKYNRDRKLGSLDYPKTRVASLPELLRRLPQKWKVEIPKNSEMPSNGVRNLDFQRLHNFRNKLTHFESVSWSLEIEGLPRIIRE